MKPLQEHREEIRQEIKCETLLAPRYTRGYWPEDQFLEAARAFQAKRSYLAEGHPSHAFSKADRRIHCDLGGALGALTRYWIASTVGERLDSRFNLILNSIEAMIEEGWQARELMITSRSGNRDEAMVAVQDTGKGIDPQESERIFDAFITTKKGELGLVRWSRFDGHEYCLKNEEYERTKSKLCSSQVR